MNHKPFILFCIGWVAVFSALAYHYTDLAQEVGVGGLIGQASGSLIFPIIGYVVFRYVYNRDMKKAKLN